MANTIGVNVVMTADNSDLITKTRQAKNEMDCITGAGSPSPYAVPNMPSGQNGDALKGAEPAGNNAFLADNLLDLNKEMLAELKALVTHFTRGQGSPASSAAKKNDAGNGSAGRNDGVNDKIKAATVAAAIGIGSGIIANDTGYTRVRMAEWKGDAFGTHIAENNRKANAITSATSALPLVGGIVGTIFGAPMAGAALGGTLKSAVDTLVKGLNENKNTKIEEQKLHSDTYESRLKINEESLSMFGRGITKNNAVQNAKLALEMQSYFNRSANNTGMELDEFQGIANSLSRYGVSNYRSAGNLARASALAQSYTGADATDFLGTQVRLGRNEERAVAGMNYAFGASLSSGLEKGQFSEFLNGLQSAVEDGIANGFVQSTEDVSKTMVMFAKLSDNNPAWQGQYGFQRLNQMNQGLRSATSLDSTSRLMAYQSLRGLNDGKSGAEYIQGEDALNTFALMEKGFNSRSFRAIGNRFRAQYGDDVTENVLAWKQLTGLNYTGAMQLYKMQMSGKTVTEEDIKSVMANAEYNTDQKNMVNYLNDIKSNTSILGEGAFRDYLKGLAGIDTKYGKEVPAAASKGKSYTTNPDVKLNDNGKYAMDYLQTKGTRDSARDLTIIKAGLELLDPKESKVLAQRLNEIRTSPGEKESMDERIKDIVSQILEAFERAQIKVTY